MIGTFLLLILFFFFFVRNNTKGIVAIIIVSLMNDRFVIPFGFSLSIHYFIALVFIPKLLFQYKLIPKKAKGLLAPLYVEFFYLVLLAIIFGYIEPWVSRYDYERSWSQKSEGRAIVQVVRLIAEFALMLILLLWLNKKRITIDYLSKAISLIMFFTLMMAFFDTALNGGLKQIFFSGSRILGDRFTGFNGEPRAFGRICSFVLLFLVTFSASNINKLVKIGIWSSIIGLVISLSASAYLITLVWGTVFIVITQRYKYLFFGIPLILSALFFLNQNEFFREQTLKKIEVTVMDGDGYNQKEKVNAQEPEIFSSFEVFDRAALNFLYDEPVFFITGTGPNMISIPSSPYLTASSYAIYENRIDSVPHSFIINLIARSGIIGLTLWFVFFIRFKNALKGFDKKLQALFICVMLSQFIVNTSMFLLIIAVLLFIVQKKETQILK
ncbi:O-antigen ligase family protein [Flavobacterium sp. RSP15]|uniref:O-antigen ligase family protein n=1 Tax=Flavobacterium sp. RSP15 TaxID=2497485 RepID=UPI000F838C66|nr:O-antigen ligase family protein [Flavobacterium sp. RSP15]RTY86018.1 hypothetical protein EKM00_11945 [Flavobacterium sp. RSP15]